MACGEETLESIAQPVTHSWDSANVFGAWIMDPLPPAGDERKIYIMPGHANPSKVVMYSDYADLSGNRKKNIISLPTGWGGTGHLVYNGTIYYAQYNTGKVI